MHEWQACVSLLCTVASHPHDARKGRHYYTTPSQADASVYSSDAPCGRHGGKQRHFLQTNETHPKSELTCLIQAHAYRPRHNLPDKMIVRIQPVLGEASMSDCGGTRDTPDDIKDAGMVCGKDSESTRIHGR